MGPPRSRLSIPRLFLLVIIGKILASVAGWIVGSPWLLGFSVPLLLMGLYILLGIHRRDNRVSDEKFADSCYYLGFIFTLSSIVVALLDIPSLGTKLDEISIRFGAAMVSTVCGLIVRVYLVNFRTDFQDTISHAEDHLLASVERFQVHLEHTVEKLREFQTQVCDVSRSAAVQAELALQESMVNHVRQVKVLAMEPLVMEHRKLAEASAEHIKATTKTLSHALHDYAQGLVSGTLQFEANAKIFSDSLQNRLEHAVPRADYLENRLAPTLDQLQHATSEAAKNASKVASALDGLANHVYTTEKGIQKLCENVLRRTEDVEQTTHHMEALQTEMSRSVIAIAALEKALYHTVVQLTAIAETHRNFTASAQRQSELTANFEKRLAEWLPKLQETDVRVSGHVNEALHTFDRAILKVSAALTRQETVLGELTSQLYILNKQLVDNEPVSEAGYKNKHS